VYDEHAARGHLVCEGLLHLDRERSREVAVLELGDLHDGSGLEGLLEVEQRRSEEGRRLVSERDECRLDVQPLRLRRVVIREVDVAVVVVERDGARRDGALLALHRAVEDLEPAAVLGAAGLGVVPVPTERDHGSGAEGDPGDDGIAVFELLVDAAGVARQPRQADGHEVIRQRARSLLETGADCGGADGEGTRAGARGEGVAEHFVQEVEVVRLASHLDERPAARDERRDHALGALVERRAEVAFLEIRDDQDLLTGHSRAPGGCARSLETRDLVAERGEARLRVRRLRLRLSRVVVDGIDVGAVVVHRDGDGRTGEAAQDRDSPVEQVGAVVRGPVLVADAQLPGAGGLAAEEGREVAGARCDRAQHRAGRRVRAAGVVREPRVDLCVHRVAAVPVVEGDRDARVDDLDLEVVGVAG
jgi:hypothetical protein